MRKVAAVLFVVFLLVGLSTAASEDFYVNGSEPGFLKDIGPGEPRTDNSAAAGIAAVVVAAVILRGLLRYRQG